MSARQLTFVLLVGPLLVAALVAAQEPPPPPEPPPATPSDSAVAVPEPEFEGVVVSRDPETGALVELERVQAVSRERRTNRGLERYLELPGARSAVRFARGERPVLVLRVPSRAKDPYTLAALVAVQSRGDTRVLLLGTVDNVGKVERLPLPKVQLEIEKYGASSFELQPVQLRRPSEYCVLNELSRFLFCFGAD